jgi:Protein of unknown function (DUF1194)
MVLQSPKTMLKKLPLTLLSTALISWAGQVQAMTLVDVELVFLIDGSDSVSSSNFNQQLQAYENIFRDNFYETFVAPLLGQEIKGEVGLGKIAVAAFQFGGITDDPDEAFQTIVDWTEISSQAGANSIADEFENVTKIGGFTPLGFAIQETADSMFNNAFQGTQLVMDISSDGFDDPQDGLFLNPVTASNYARCAGVIADCPASPQVRPGGVDVINVITNEENLSDLFLLQEISYGTNLSGDTTTIFEANNIDDYESTLRSKIGVELSLRTPEPSLILALVSLGIFGIGSKWINTGK